MKTPIDIHNYPKKLMAARRLIRDSKIPKENKDALKRYEDYLFAKNLVIGRVVKHLCTIRLVAEYLGKEFSKVTKSDLTKFVAEINQRGYTENTKHDYKRMTRMFFQWFYGYEGDNYPEQVSWIPVKRDRTKLNEIAHGDLITEEEIMAAVEAADHPRDKALIIVLCESAFRIGELGSLQIRSLAMQDNKVFVTCNGKTGPRQILLIASRWILGDWLNMHPTKDDPNSPLWPQIRGKNKGKPMTYASIRSIILNVFKKAGINKRVWAHLLRHSRGTSLSEVLSTPELEQQLGHAPGSKQTREYIHLSNKSRNNKIMELNGIKSEEKRESLLKPKRCCRCSALSSFNDKICRKCNQPLDLNYLPLNAQRETDEQIMSRLMSDPETQAFLLEKVKKMAENADNQTSAQT
jgi:integrase